MVITGLDLETTGVDVHKGDRIIELCMGIYEYNGTVLSPRKVITQRINPERSIPADAQAIHGISYEDVKAAPKFGDIADTVAKVLERTNLLVIHNAAFDQEFLWAEMQRVGRPISHQVSVFCTMTNGRWATFDGKSPTLQELAWSLGIDYDRSAAHAADYDVTVMMECYRKGLALGFFNQPKEV